MDNGASSSSDSQRLPDGKPVTTLPVDNIASPTSSTYSDPPPTYHHATGDGPQSGSSTEEENIPRSIRRKKPKPYRQATVISTTTTTTTTSTTSLTTTRPGPSRLSTLARSKSTESLISINSKASDPYLDALLARSVAALELSNALLQSTMATQSTLSSVLANDEALERRERAFEERLLRSANPSFRDDDDPNGPSSRLAIEEREGKKMEWMREMESIVRDVEALFDIPSPPASSGRQRRATLDSQGSPQRENRRDGGGLVYGDHSASTRAPPPRALTQYVSISGANANASAGEATAGKHEIYLPSTTGLRKGPHREVLAETKDERGYSRSIGHSPTPSASSRGGGGGKYLSPIPATHPEALPLSPQELLELHNSEKSSPTKGKPETAQDGVDRHAYLRRFNAHSVTPSVSSDGFGAGSSANASASSTLSRTRGLGHGATRPLLTPFQPARGPSHAHTPSTAGFTAFPSFSAQDLGSSQLEDQAERASRKGRPDHSRNASNATTNSITSASSAVSVPSIPSPSRRSSRSSTRSSLSINSIPFSLSLPLPSSIGAAFRRSPSLRGLASPTSTDGSDVGDAGYSPALEAIGDFGEEGEDDISSSNDTRGRNPSLQSPSRGRAILRGRFRTADTLRRILDTSPSPLSISKPAPPTSPIDKGKSVARDIIIPSTRSNTDSSNKTITRTMRDSFAAADEQLALSIPVSTSYTLEGSKEDIHKSPGIHFMRSSRGFAPGQSPSTVSSTSDLNSSDADRRDRDIKRRSSLRPMPRFMPRTPAGRTAILEVSGATARAPKMHAHLVDIASPETDMPTTPDQIVDTPVAEQNVTVEKNPDVALIDKSPPPSIQEIQERRRTQSLSASVSSMLGQARALESAKLASAGKVKGGSNLKGSPAWQAQRRLVDHASLDGGSSAPQSPQIHHESTGSGHSKRTSWLGASLSGLGLAVTPSSSNASGASTPAMRVSFAKEPVRYSEEREQGAIDDDEEEEEGDEGQLNVKDLDAEVDGTLTIKQRSLRRTKSWNNSVKGIGSRKVPSKRRSKAENKEKKEGWLEWFLTAAAGSSPGPGHMGVSSSSMGIGREEMFESRTRDDW
ncbi:hypothetical protein M408DRAFT_333033 [Serendipita vermifera MAFF 305830]|uniref:Uncharacterized protein n=1 Tax=Serendipita vermifera MAFF 305830 TaxID=933852 RepID=A0A0C3AQ74_SERVB|nr:hypothetical protein M408DRAFT_333033 [Serendipita vermifera MAFF 305830]